MIEQILFIFMFVSGIVFSVQDVAPPLRDWLSLNPMLALVDAVRGILMHGQWPDWIALLRVSVISPTLFLVSLYVIHRLTPRYVKLAG